MVTITIVEPNALLRMGIQQALKKLAYDISCIELDYTQLFKERGQTATDLMLLAAPEDTERMLELVEAAQRGYQPQRIVLMSDALVLPYSPLYLPSSLGGYISKIASADVMLASVTLVLAGGTCFPAPIVNGGRPGGQPLDGSITPRRRWYEQTVPLSSGAEAPAPQTDPLAQPDLRLCATSCAEKAMRALKYLPLTGEPAQWLSADLIESESALLNLTPRQYVVLALLARGYPLKKISRELNISLATAKTHAEAIYVRLSVNSRNAAVYSAVSRGASLGWPEPRGMIDH